MADEQRPSGENPVAPPTGKTKWVERQSPAADDPMTDDEKNGLQMLGGSNARGGALPSVSEPSRDGEGASRKRDETREGAE